MFEIKKPLAYGGYIVKKGGEIVINVAKDFQEEWISQEADRLEEEQRDGNNNK